ncbi:MAG: peptidoglycan DD-metalloendopeptidase family protein [Pseudomonadota bacterium]
MKRGWVAAMLFLWALPVQADRVLDEKQKNLRTYQQKIGEQRGQLKTLSVRERSLHTELGIFSSRIERLNDQIVRLEKERRETAERIGTTESAIAKLEQSIESGKSQLRHRLRSMYVRKKPSLVRVVLSSRSPNEFRERWWLVRHWIDSDRIAIQEYQRKAEELLGRRASLTLSQKKHLKVLADLDAGRRDLSREREARSKLLSLVRTQREYYEQSVRELTQASRDLQKLIEALRGGESEGDSLFARMRGRLSLPVRGVLERSYGPYTDGRLKIRMYNKGIDLRAREGSEVRAVFDGKVVYAGWFVGYGKVLILDHGGGYFTLYAHLSTTEKGVGEKVAAGETVGQVGDTGSLKGSYLYFELRKKGISEDPWPWFGRGSS